MKRVNILLLIILCVAVGLFGCYLMWVHNNLDITAPVITVEDGILEISVEDPEEALMQGITAMDDRDGDVTATMLVESVYGISEDHITTVTYAAFDRAGNVGKIERQVRYKDYQEPRFELYGSLTFSSTEGFDLLEYVGARDVLEGDIRRRVHATLISDTKSINSVGTHQVKFQVTNGLGDTVETVLPVEVYDPEWYSAEVVLTDYLLYLDQGARFDAEKYLEAFVVRGELVDMSSTASGDVKVDIVNGVNTRIPGVYEVTYVLSQDVNMTTFSGIAKLIVIVEG